MCTLIVLHRCPGQAPLVVAANRDEYYDRPAQGPQLRIGPGGVVVAPLDVRAGGTWLGVNRSGVFVGVTNRPTSAPDPTRRSRGLLVLDALAEAKAVDAAALLAELPPRTYNPFNLYVADGRDAFAVVYQDAPALRPLDAGVHVISNADPDDRRVPKIARQLRSAEEAAAGAPARLLEALADVCRAHEGDENPLFDTCIHTPRYGTRSSTLLRLGDPRAPDALHYADGPPCTTDYDDSSHLLHELGKPRVVTGDSATRTVR